MTNKELKLTNEESGEQITLLYSTQIFTLEDTDEDEDSLEDNSADSDSIEEDEETKIELDEEIRKLSESSGDKLSLLKGKSEDLTLDEFNDKDKDKDSNGYNSNSNSNSNTSSPDRKSN